MEFYKTGHVPETYKCHDCGAHGCKLWREYQTFNPDVVCALCAGKRQNKDVSRINEAGLLPWKMSGDDHEILTDSIGWYVPCVPTEEGDTYWGYTSVPEDGVDWWKKLPSLRGAR